LKENSTVFLNGEIFAVADSLKLDNNLKNLDRKLIVAIIPIKSEGQIGCADNDLIFIEYAVELPRTLIRNRIDEMQSLFNDKYFGFSGHILTNSKDPVLYINNRNIHHTEVKAAIKSLDKNEIAYINIKTNPQNQELYGENGKNGIVVIWTEKELAKISH